MKSVHHFMLAIAVFLFAALAAPAADAARKKSGAPEELYPMAERESPAVDSNTRLQRKLNAMFDKYNKQDYEGALAAAEEIIGTSSAKPYDVGVSQLIAGQSHYSLGDTAKAIEYINQAIEGNALANNNHFEAMKTLVVAYEAEGQVDQALAMLERLTTETKTGDQPDMLALKGQMLYNERRYDEAIPLLEKAVAASEAPKPGMLTALMAAYAETDQTEKALGLAKQLYDKNPDDKTATFNLANLYFQADQGEQAVALLNQARAKGMLSEQSDYMDLFSNLYNMPGREKEAAMVLSEGLEKGIVQPSAQAYGYLGEAYFISDDYANAVKAYEKAAPLAANGKSYLRLAQFLNLAERYGEAAAAGRQALAKGLDKPGQAWMEIGHAAYYQDDIAGARKAYGEASKDASTRGEAQRWLSQIGG